MKNLYCFLMAIALAAIPLAPLLAQYEGQISFNQGDVSITQSDGWCRVTVPGCQGNNQPGMPALPVKPLSIVIPVDQEVSGIEILSIQQTELPGTYFNLMPEQPEAVPDLPAPGFYPANTQVYSTDAFWPAGRFAACGSGFRHGAHLAVVLFSPLQYNPVTEKIKLATQVNYRLLYTAAANHPVVARRISWNFRASVGSWRVANNP